MILRRQIMCSALEYCDRNTLYKHALEGSHSPVDDGREPLDSHLPAKTIKIFLIDNAI